jgi:regulator of protease activity HflC (stomatin/prohibitin superfamily)
MVMRSVTIKTDERGLLFHKGSYIRMLAPGTYRYAPWSKDTAVVMNIAQAFAVEGKPIQLFLHDQQLLRELEVVQVQDHEVVLHYEDGQFAAVLKPGIHAFWNVLKKHAFIRGDIRNPELPPELDTAVLPKIAAYVQTYEVQNHESGVLFYNHAMQRELAPGRYHFWKGPVAVQVKTVDLRQQQMDLTGQELMTEDKVTLRLNFVCQYKILDPLRALSIRSYDEQMHIMLQLLLREYVGSLKLDELLKMKQEIGAYMMKRLAEKNEEYGVQFLGAGVKDIILPGDMKDILNTVLLAEKKAQANLVMRREETASTRSLLNTAKLMEENQTLFRLKELEFLEKICEKIGTISLSSGSGGNLLEQLNALVGERGSAGQG